MPKRVFWPLTLVIMGLIFMASNVGLLPASFWNLWPLILVIVGLGGLLTSDKEDWDGQPAANKSNSKSATTKKSSKRRK